MPCSSVEGKHPVAESGPERYHAPDAPETSVVLVGPLPDVLVRAVAEGSVRGHLAGTQLVITGLTDIERHWTAASHHPLALAVAERPDLGVAASAPVVLLATLQVRVHREDTRVDWQTRRTVPTFFVRAAFQQVLDWLLGEVCHVVHADCFSLQGGGSDDFGFESHDVSFVGLAFAAGGVNVNIVFDSLQVRRLRLVFFVWEQVVDLVIHFDY